MDEELYLNDFYGLGIADDIKDYFGRVKDFFSTLKKLPRKTRNFLEKYGKEQILEIKIYRAPVQSVIKEILNILSFGTAKKKIKQMHYDDLFHLALYFRLNNYEGLLEKNHIIEINPFKKQKDYELLDVDLKGKNLTLNELVNNTKNGYKDDKEFVSYNYIDNNCQRFVYTVLLMNGLSNEKNEKFILQNVEKVLSSAKYADKFINFLTDLAARGEILIHGSGIYIF